MYDCIVIIQSLLNPSPSLSGDFTVGFYKALRILAHQNFFFCKKKNPATIQLNQDNNKNKTSLPDRERSYCKRKEKTPGEGGCRRHRTRRRCRFKS